MSNLRDKISPEVQEIQILGDKHRAIRSVLELCESELSDSMYDYLADIHDDLVNQKKLKMRKITGVLKQDRLTKNLYEKKEEPKNVDNVIYVDFTKKRSKS